MEESENISEDLKMVKDMVKVFLNKRKIVMYIQVLINNAVKHAHGEFIFEKAKMKIAGEWENGKILKGKWIFPNGTYFEGPFINNFPKDEGVWYFTN